MRLHDLKPAKNSKKKRKRVGRGQGSGYAKNCGRGNKGQKSRSGYTDRPWFEGGQMPLYRRLSGKGHNNPFRKEYQVVNVKQLNNIEEGTEVTLDVLQSHGFISNSDSLTKILGDGELNVKLTIKAHAFSKSAKRKIVEAGGEAIIIGEEAK